MGMPGNGTAVNRSIKNEKSVIKRAKFSPVFFFFIIIPLLFLYSSCTGPFAGFEILSVSLEGGSIIGTEKEPITLVFSSQPDLTLITDSISIQKDSAGSVEYDFEVNGNELTLTPEDNWDELSRFWLIISSSFANVYGKTLGTDFLVSFVSTEQRLPVSAVFILPDIADRPNIVNTDLDRITLRFSDDVNILSVQKNFSISPSVSGYFSWNGTDEFSYIFTETLSKNRFYEVSVSQEAKDISGYSLKAFSKGFEYYSSEEKPFISLIEDDSAAEFFNDSNTGSYLFHDGYYYVEADKAEKDGSWTIGFSKFVDKDSVENSISVSPSVDYTVAWADAGDHNIMTINFTEILDINETYDLTISKAATDLDGLALKAGIRLSITVNGDYSEFLLSEALSPSDFTGKSVIRKAIFYDDDNPGTTSESTSYAVTYNSSTNQYRLKIAIVNYSDFEKLSLIFLFSFSYPSGSALPAPNLDELSYITGVSIDTVYTPDLPDGSENETADIESFVTPDGMTSPSGDQFYVTVKNLVAGGIYKLTLKGGNGGIKDGNFTNGNYLEQSVDFYFILIVDESL